MTDWLSEDKFVIDQLIKPMVNLYRISAGPTPIAFVRQKRMAIKEDIRFFADESETPSSGGSRRARCLIQRPLRRHDTLGEKSAFSEIFASPAPLAAILDLSAEGASPGLSMSIALCGGSRRVPLRDFVPIPFHFTIDGAAAIGA